MKKILLKSVLYSLSAIILIVGSGCSSSGEFSQLWKVDISDVKSAVIVPTPIEIIVLTNYNHLYAINAETGKTDWEKELPADVYNGIAVYQGLLMLGDANGVLTVYDLETGEEQWNLTTDGSFLSPFHFSSGNLYCGAGSAVYSINLEKESVNWSTEMGREGSVWAMPVVADQQVYVQFREYIYSLDGQDGTELWSYKTCEYSAGDYDYPVAIMQGKVFTGTPTKNFIALDAKSGELAWEYNAADDNWNDRMIVEPFALSGKVVFGFESIDVLEESEEGPSSENSGHVVCLATAMGTELWEYNAPAFSDIAYEKNNAYLIEPNTLHKINLRNGKGKAIKLPGEYTSGLEISGGKAYYISDEKYLICGKL